MPYNLSTILSKKSWTGEDVGKILILSLIDSYRQMLSGVRHPKPILPEAKMRRMIRSINGTESLTTYNRYVGLNDWLMQNHPVALNYKQQAVTSVERTIEIIETARAAEENFRYLESLPMILTARQYEKKQKKHVLERLHEKEGCEYDLFAVFGMALSHFLRRLETNPRAANPIKSAIKKHGALEAEPGIAFRGEILRDEIVNCFPAFFKDDRSDDARQAEAFQKMFRDVYKAVTQALGSARDGRELGRIAPHEWRDVVFSYRELYERDFFGIRENIQDLKSIFSDNPRATRNGIAVIPKEMSPHASALFDHSKFLSQNKLSATLGLERFTPENKAHQSHAERILNDRRQIVNGYYFALGFDEAIRMIGEYVDLPNFGIFTIEATEIADQISRMNELSAAFREDIARNEYLDEPAKARKIMILDEYFKPLRWKKIKTSAKGIETAKEMLYDNMRAFDIADGRFLAALTYRQEGEP